MALRLTIRIPTLLAVAVAVLFAVTATALIRANAQSNIAAERVPLPVTITRFEMTDGYTRKTNYIGTVRAGNDSAVGFEVGGTLETVPAREGLRVNAGEVLATLNSERRQTALNQAKARLDQALADRDLGQKRLARAEAVVARGLASQQSLDEAALSAAALEAGVVAARAALRNAQLEIEKSTLRAPYDAIVAERLLQPGAAVGVGTPVLRLVMTASREAYVGIPATRATDLIPGHQYTVRLRNQRFRAELQGLRNDVDPITLTVGAILALPADAPVTVGEPVVLELEETVPAEGGWLPLTALIEGHRGLWSVLTVARTSGAPTSVRESVEVIHVSDDRAFVRGTLANGAEVIATGLQRISPGAVIEPNFLGER